MNPVDSLPDLCARVRARMCEIEIRARRSAKLDMGARMAAVRLAAADHGLAIV